MDDPRAFGALLRSSGGGPGAVALWRYRAGDWRIVAHLDGEVLRIPVLRIAHRREVCLRP